MSHCVDVSCYIHWYFTFSESLGRVFLAIYTDISPSVSHWVVVSRYIHWHFTFSEPLGGCFLLYTLTFHLQSATVCGFLAIYTDISPLVSHLVDVSCYIHWHFTFNEPLCGCFLLYTLTFHLQWATGWMFLAIYTDISPSVSHWVGVSRYIHWHFTFSEPLGGSFSLYTLTFHLQWVTGWMFLAIYTDISPSVSHCVVGFSLYTLTFHLQWATGWIVSRYIHWHFTFSESTGWMFLAIYTDIWGSVSHWVDVSRYIHWHLRFSESLGGGFSLYTLTFHLEWVTGWVLFAIYSDISPSVSHWVDVSLYIHWHFTFNKSLGGGF